MRRICTSITNIFIKNHQKQPVPSSNHSELRLQQPSPVILFEFNDETHHSCKNQTMLLVMVDYSMNALPEELFIYTMDYLSFCNVWVLRLVCQNFNQLIKKHHLLWKQHKRSLLFTKGPCADTSVFNKMCQLINKRCQIQRVAIEKDSIDDITTEKLVNVIQEQENRLTSLELSKVDLAQFSPANATKKADMIEQINPANILMTGSRIRGRYDEHSHLGLMNVLLSPSNLHGIAIEDVMYVHERYPNLNDETLGIADFQWIKTFYGVKEKEIRHLKQLFFQRSSKVLFHLLMCIVDLTQIQSLSLDIRRFDPEINDLQFKKLRQFSFVHTGSTQNLNKNIINNNIKQIEKIGIHFVEYKKELTGYLPVIKKCGKIKTIQVYTDNEFNFEIIEWLFKLLQAIKTSSSCFALILSCDPHHSETLELHLSKHLSSIWQIISDCTTDYAILARIIHGDFEYSGNTELVSIYSTEEYNVHGDDGQLIKSPCDICVVWCMIIKKGVTPDLIVGEFYISDNLDDEERGTNEWWRPNRLYDTWWRK